MKLLKVSNFRDYSTIRKWILAYYPELIFFMKDFTVKEEEFNKDREYWILSRKAKFRKDYARLGRFSDLDKAFQNLKDYYQNTFSNISISDVQLRDEVEMIIKRYDMSEEEIGDTYSYIVMDFEEVSSVLKWRCPIPAVRKNLYREGVISGKLEWFYRLFWKGKKYINYEG